MEEKKQKLQSDRETPPQRQCRWSRRKSWASKSHQFCRRFLPMFHGENHGFLAMSDVFYRCFIRKPMVFWTFHGEIQWFWGHSQEQWLLGFNLGTLEPWNLLLGCKARLIIFHFQSTMMVKGSQKPNDFQHVDVYIFVEPVWSLAQLFLEFGSSCCAMAHRTSVRLRKMHRKKSRQALRAFTNSPRMRPKTSSHRILPPTLTHLDLLWRPQILQVTGKRPALHLNRPGRVEPEEPEEPG